MRGALALLLLAACAQAGQEVGNGGNVVLCAGRNPELLDLVEARMMEKGSFNAPVAEQDFFARVCGRLRDLARLDPVFAARLTQGMAGYPKEFQFLEHADLSGVSDSLHLALPKGCRLRQAAIRRREAAPGEPRFVVDGSLWRQLDVRARAALILHELIYQEMIAFGATDSREARRLNALIAGDGFARLELPAYVRFVSALPHFRSRLSIGGIDYETSGLELFADGKVKRGRPASDTAAIEVGGNRYVFSAPNAKFSLEFFATGVPVSGWLSAPTEVTLGGARLRLEYLVKFAPSGAITEASRVDADGKVLGSYAERK